MTISKLKVFSREIHQTYENELEILGALKVLKYFYNLPIGQLFTALSILWADNPTSQWWKAASLSIYTSSWAVMKVCDFFKEYVSTLILTLKSVFSEIQVWTWVFQCGFPPKIQGSNRSSNKKLTLGHAWNTYLVLNNLYVYILLQAIHQYDDFALEMEVQDPHAVYPTNIYRQCDGYTVSSKDCSTIESVMSTTLTTTIKIRQKYV